MKKILISGGGGNLAKEIVKANKSYNILSLSKSQLNICNKDELDKIISEIKPDIFIHTAALTRPMVKHIESPDVSIKNNIIGTSKKSNPNIKEISLNEIKDVNMGKNCSLNITKLKKKLK